MFDIGWSELVIIAVVALIAIGPKELPGVLRMAGQWMAKLRRMAADFQGQFNEAMREAEMADIKKQFDEIKDTAKSFTGANLLSDVQKDFDSALKLDDKPAADKPAADTPAAAATDTPATTPTDAAPAAAQADEPKPAVTTSAAGADDAGADAGTAPAATPEPDRATAEPVPVGPAPVAAVVPAAETGAVKAS